ncbi:IspD/TarI family cytidylyltransferase, partial [Sandarakinorhabdus limnophila]
MRIHAIIVAAGAGLRAGGGVPKQYRAVAGQPLLRHAVKRLLGHPAITGVSVVINPECRALYDEAVAGLGLSEPIVGGATRQESVLAGLEALAADPPDIVLVHDAAR